MHACSRPAPARSDAERGEAASPAASAPASGPGSPWRYLETGSGGREDQHRATRGSQFTSTTPSKHGFKQKAV